LRADVSSATSAKLRRTIRPAAVAAVSRCSGCGGRLQRGVATAGPLRSARRGFGRDGNSTRRTGPPRCDSVLAGSRRDCQRPLLASPRQSGLQRSHG
jgi:hypothetical protein